MDLANSLLPWHAHATTVLVAHLVWCTRGRSPWLEPRFDAWLASLLRRKARRIECQLLAAGMAHDHVHLLVRHPPRICVAQLAHRLKGASSHALRHELGNNTAGVWQVGYWAESVSPRDLETLAPYVTRQRAHHAARPDAEDWELSATSSPPARAGF